MSDVAPDVGHFDDSQREELAQAWTRVALLEHASIAAFARFTLQLMGVGAPASMIESATAAMADETKHAKLGFAVASAYAGRAIGPGSLDMQGALAETSLREVMVTTIREGCLGETMAAIEATEALPYVTDPVLRSVLGTIAEDESRHAQLAWKFVRWALEQGGDEVVALAREEFARATLAIDPVVAPITSENAIDADERNLLTSGILPERLSRLIRAACMNDVVGPCAEALLAGFDRHPVTGASAAHA